LVLPPLESFERVGAYAIFFFFFFLLFFFYLSVAT
jgi:hypothetical protein